MAVATSLESGLIVSRAGARPVELSLAVLTSGARLPALPDLPPPLPPPELRRPERAAYAQCLQSRPGAVSDVVVHLSPDDPASNARLLLFALTGAGEAQGDGTSLFGAPGRVWIGPGVFPVGGTLRLGHGQFLIGAGRVDGTTLQAAGAGTMLQIESGAALVGLRDLELQGAAGQGIGVTIPRASHVTVERVRFSDFRSGIVAGSGGWLPGVDLLRISGCELRGCETSIRAARFVRELRVVGCVIDMPPEAAAGVVSDGDGALLTANRFLALEGGGSKGPGLVVGGRGTWVRFNVFEGSPPHVVLRPATTIAYPSPGIVVEHNVHLTADDAPADRGPFVRAEGGLPAILRESGLQAQRTGESAWNLLRNGSFEHWRDGGQPTAWSVRRLAAQGIPEVRVEPLPATVGGLEIRSEGDVDGPSVLSPGARHGASAARILVETEGGDGMGVALRGQLAALGDRGTGTDGQLTFSCWVRVPPPGEGFGVPVPYVRWWSGGREVARSPGYNTKTLGTWQLLSCTVEGRPTAADLHPEIVLGPEAADFRHVDPAWDTARLECHVDGAQVNAGLLVMEPSTCPIAEDGGSIIGSVSLSPDGGMPLLLKIRVVPAAAARAGANAANDAVVVPTTGSLESVRVGTTADLVLVQLLRLRNVGGAVQTKELRAFKVNRADLPPGEVAASWANPREVQAGDLIVAQVEGMAGAPVDVELRLRVRRFPGPEVRS